MSAQPETTAPAADLLVEWRQHHGSAVLWLTINRPERRNAMNAAVLAGIAAALQEAEADRSVRAVVVTGVGSKAFCAGADLQGGLQGKPEAGQTANAFLSDYSEPYAALAKVLRIARASTVPLIARVNGACMAGGMGFLAMCDMAVASERAIFGLPEVKVGVFPAQVLAVLQHQLPRRVLTELCITGEPVGAQEALVMGLINHIATTPEGADEAATLASLDAKLDWLLGRLLDKSPAAIRRGLYMLKRIESMGFEESISFAESQIALFTLAEDAKEGQKAFQEKRKPVWTGR